MVFTVKGVDWFQSTNKCCGIYSSRDWRLNDYQCSRQDRYVGTCSPPESCCKGNLACHYDETYDTGCLIVIGRVYLVLSVFTVLLR